MIKLTVLWSLLLMVAVWVGSVSPAIAQPSPTTPVILAASSGGQSLFKFSGKRPDNLGVNDGNLAPCPDSPNCVSSQAPESDSQHYISAIAFEGSATDALTQLKSVIQAMDRTEIMTETEDYLYAEFTSKLMGYVDDVEFYVQPEQNLIQVRSASRLGQSDLGVNRQRIEEIRTKFTAKA